MDALVGEFLTSDFGTTLYKVARYQGRGGMETGVQAAFHCFLKKNKGLTVEREVKYAGSDKACDIVVKSGATTTGIELKVERDDGTGLKNFHNELSLDVFKLITEPLLAESVGKFKIDDVMVLGLVWSEDQWDALNVVTNNLTDASHFEQKLLNALEVGAEDCPQLVVDGEAPNPSEWGYITIRPKAA
mmetsp:Transcript_89525/g.225150  ORF Transcript_89525/g.225150 Transcript_89525/m.225150 type:complete len:188 (-) Transcript_89525:188-751(-)